MSSGFPHCPWREVSDTDIAAIRCDKSHTLPAPTPPPPPRCPPPHTHIGLPTTFLPFIPGLIFQTFCCRPGIHQDSLRSSDIGEACGLSLRVLPFPAWYSPVRSHNYFFFFPPKSVWMWHFHLLLPSSLLSLIRVVTFTWAAPFHNKWKKGEGGRTGRYKVRPRSSCIYSLKKSK